MDLAGQQWTIVHRRESFDVRFRTSAESGLTLSQRLRLRLETRRRQTVSRVVAKAD
jgi:hypothetical protein